MKDAVRDSKRADRVELRAQSDHPDLIGRKSSPSEVGRVQKACLKNGLDDIGLDMKSASIRQLRICCRTGAFLGCKADWRFEVLVDLTGG